MPNCQALTGVFRSPCGIMPARASSGPMREALAADAMIGKSESLIVFRVLHFGIENLKSSPKLESRKLRTVATRAGDK